jgi:hypothetical protein
MAALPNMPVFVTSETPSIAKLTQLAYCVTFISVLPAYAQLTQNTQSIPNATATALTWSAPGTDRDGGWAAGHATRYTANTPGYYQFDALAQFAAVLGGARYCYFQVTNGPNNPAGAGTTVFGQSAAASATGAAGLTMSALTPYLYLLDYAELFVFQSTGAALNTGTCTWQVTLASLGP